MTNTEVALLCAAMAWVLVGVIIACGLAVQEHKRIKREKKDFKKNFKLNFDDYDQ